MSAEYGGVTLTPPDWLGMPLSWAALRALSAALGPLFVPLGRSSAALGPPFRPKTCIQNTAGPELGEKNATFTPPPAPLQKSKQKDEKGFREPRFARLARRLPIERKLDD